MNEARALDVLVASGGKTTKKTIDGSNPIAEMIVEGRRVYRDSIERVWDSAVVYGDAHG